MIPGSKGSRRLPVSLGRPHGGPCEEVQSAGNEFEPGTSAGRSRNPEELNRPSEPDLHNLRGVPNAARSVQTEACKSSWSETSEPQNPSPGSPTCRGGVRCSPAVRQGGLAVGASGIACRVVPIPDVSQPPMRCQTACFGKDELAAQNEFLSGNGPRRPRFLNEADCPSELELPHVQGS